MSDASRLYEVVFKLVHRHCKDLLRPEHRITLSQMIAGILRSSSVQFHKIARKLRYNGKKTSLENKFRRFVRNGNIKVSVVFLPFFDMILEALGSQNIILMIDGTKVGPACTCLMLSLYYKGRAMPLCWAVYKGKKGHSTCELQLDLLKRVLARLGEERQVVLLGDGEFDSSDLIKWLEARPNWQYVCRTATNIQILYNNEWLELQKLPLIEGTEQFFISVLFTKTGQVGPLNILAIWNEEEKRHWFMVTNISSFEEATEWYRFRFTIETFFSDAKSRGFNLDETRLRKPRRVSRLILAVAMAYVFTVCFGVQAIIRRSTVRLCRVKNSHKKRNYSLFQIGLMYIDDLLNEYLPFPDISLPPPETFDF